MTTDYWTVDQYIGTFPRDVQQILAEIRQTIKVAAPEAEEMISRQMPAFSLYGELIRFAAHSQHIGLYGIGAAFQPFSEELAPFFAATATLRFPLDKPIPLELISKLVHFIAQHGRAASIATAKRPHFPVNSL